MAFHHDIFRYRDLLTGENEFIECEYTVHHCIELGWLSTEGIWERKIIEAPDTELIYLGLPRPDPNYGVDYGLKLVKDKNGKWESDVGNGLLFR